MNNKIQDKSKNKQVVDKLLDNVFFIYSIIGFILYLPFVLHIPMDYVFGALFSDICLIYFYSELYVFPFIFTLYCLFRNYDPNSKKNTITILLSMIDASLSFLILCTYPFGFNYTLYNENKLYFYSLGFLFSLMPASFYIVKKKKIDWILFKKIITRIFMILVLGYTLYVLTSCSSSL